MTGEQAVVAIIEALNELRWPHMLTGSLASNFHGIARATMDADFVVGPGPGPIEKIAELLGPDFRIDPQTSFETVTATTRHIIQPTGTKYSLELFLLSDDQHDQERFRRRLTARVLGVDTHVPTAEDVVITKLRWSRQGKRSKDLSDARNVLAVQGDCLDRAYMRAWCGKHGTLDLLEALLSASPDG